MTGVLVVFGCWIYAAVSYAWFLGIAFGWTPSLIIGGIAAFLWPIIALVIGAIVLFVAWSASY